MINSFNHNKTKVYIKTQGYQNFEEKNAKKKKFSSSID